MDSAQIKICLALLFLSIVPFSFSASLTLQVKSKPQRLLQPDTQNTITRENYLRNRLNTDLVKVSALADAHSASADLFSGLELSGYSEYVVSLAIGTPAQDIELVLDLWGDVLWLQCEKCTNCYNQTNTIFDPANSTSYSTLKCGDNTCSQLQRSQASNCSLSDTCLYNQTYGKDWYTAGEFSTETFTIGNTPVEKVAFGCGHDNEGEFDDTDGFLTLSRGPMSFVSQTEPQFGEKFSYCLSSITNLPASNSSSITFGDAATPPKNNTTPLVKHKRFRNYFVALKAISVDGIRLKGFNESAAFDIDEEGNGSTMLDLITAFTFLTTPVDDAMKKAFREAMNNTHMPESPYPGLDTCYDLSNKTVEEMNVPSVVLHFPDLDLKLPVENYFVMTDYNGTHCLAFASFPRKLSFSVLGNLLQQGIQVSYDLPNSLIGLTTNACA